jgi:hypothetical protein
VCKAPRTYVKADWLPDHADSKTKPLYNVERKLFEDNGKLSNSRQMKKGLSEDNAFAGLR